FAATAGVVRRGYDTAPYNTLIPDSHQASAFLSGNYELTDSIELFAEALFSHVENEYQVRPLIEFSALSVPASNPYTPFGVPVKVGTSYTFSGLGPNNTTAETTFLRPLVGIKGQLPAGWVWQASAWRSQESDVESNVQLSSSAVTRALATTDPNQALDPFGGPGGSPRLLKSLTYDLYERYHSVSNFAEAYARGPLVNLPAGPLQLVLGSDYQRQTLEFHFLVPNDPTDAAIYYGPNHNSTYSRNSYSVYAEARIPLVNAQIVPAIGESLTATAAGRFDHYSDFGGTTNPQFGLEWRPLTKLLVRADYGRSFQAPTLAELYSPQSTFSQTVQDPRRNNETVTVPYVSGGNPNLLPESGYSRSFGVVYSDPGLLGGFMLSLNDWTIVERNSVNYLYPAILLANESLFPGRVIRDPSGGPTPGPITGLDATDANYGEISASGVDATVKLTIKTMLGSFTPNVAATTVYKFDAAITPGSPSQSVVGNEVEGTGGTSLFSPRWKGTTGVGWSKGPYQANFAARYVGPYLDPSGYRAGNDWLYDLFVRCELGQVLFADRSALRGTHLSFGVVNLTNKLPAYAHDAGLGYDPGESDIRGRYLYGEIGVKF
ncbi:MAG TPA: TonB-dependent receptor, partial [Steroidobacteraceae bacterium]